MHIALLTKNSDGTLFAPLLIRRLAARYNEADMFIQGGFKHVNESFSADRFLKLLAQEAPGAHYFVARPPEGIIMTAAIDWRVIATDSNCIDALAAALWSAYESLVKPLQTDAKEPCPLIFIQIKNLKGESDQFAMGKDVDKKEIFLHRLKESAAMLSSKDRESALKLELERTTGSDYWVKVC